MKCPNCNTESNGQKWCPGCGIQLEMDDIVNPDYEITFDEDTDSYEEESDSFNEESPFDYEPESTDSSKALKIVLGVILGIGFLLMIVVILMKVGIIGGTDKAEDVSSSSEQTVLEQENIENLLKKGQTYLSIGDYESAEAVYKAIIETDVSNEEATLLYQIVYNYNRACKKLETKKYEDARVFFDKIPLDYMDYPISDDVENLEDEITTFETNARTFDKVEQYMSREDYESASDSIGLLNTEYLTTSELDMLSGYKKEIEDYENNKNKEKSEANDSGKEFDTREAESFIGTYCKALVSAINSGDFKLVSDYLKGDLYNKQKKLVETCYKDGITEDFEFLTVKSLNKESDNLWKVKVSEGETIHYADGTESAKTFSWIYTVESINGKYYITKIE